MATPKSTLSKFILSLPSTLTGAQVVERAKAKGLKTSRANVSRVRNLFRTSTKAKAPVKDAPAKTATATAGASSRSKAEFVRSFPSGTSPKEIVSKAKAAGVRLGTAYVYNVWTRDKAKGGKRRGAAKPAVVNATAANGGARLVVPAGSSVENLLKAVAAEIGLGRAVDVLQAERHRVRSLLQG